jgi:hypothetical protein
MDIATGSDELSRHARQANANVRRDFIALQFLTAGDLSTPNLDYFKCVDDTTTIAARDDFLVLLPLKLEAGRTCCAQTVWPRPSHICLRPAPSLLTCRNSPGSPPRRAGTTPRPATTRKWASPDFPSLESRLFAAVGKNSEEDEDWVLSLETSAVQ